MDTWHVAIHNPILDNYFGVVRHVSTTSLQQCYLSVSMFVALFDRLRPSLIPSPRLLVPQNQLLEMRTVENLTP